MNTKQYHYHCPCCKSEISKDNIVEFEIQNYKKQRAQLKISGVPGVYNFTINGLKHLGLGETFEFFCPKCKSNLRSKRYCTFVEVDLKLSETSWLNVYFSPVQGDSKTLVLINDDLFTDNFQFPTWKREDQFLPRRA